MSTASINRALATEGLDTAETFLLVCIAHHDGDGGAWPSVATLAGYMKVTPRRVRQILASLVDKGVLVRHLNGGGNERTPRDKRPNRYEINPRGVNWVADRGVKPIADEQPLEQPSQSSSLREDDAVETQVARDTPRAADDGAKPREQFVATAYWDRFVAENEGLRPTWKWMALVSACRVAVKSGASDDEIVDALIAHGGRPLSGKALVERIGDARRRAADRPNTTAIPSAVLRAVNGVATRAENRAALGRVAYRDVLQSVTWLHERGTPIPQAIGRLAVFLRWCRDHDQLTVNALTDPSMPFSSKPDTWGTDLAPEAVFDLVYRKGAA